MTKLSQALQRLALTLTCLGVASPSFGNEAHLPPPYEGFYQPQGVDEIGWWRKDDESERALLNSPVLIRDEKLNDYVTDVLCRTVGYDRCSATRVYILREPVFNASMTMNGTMRVFSGLLLRTRNEAELASVLGHEFAHFEMRHGLQRFKKWRSGSDIRAWASVLTNLSNNYSVHRSLGDLNYQIYGSYFRFSRDNEREADLLGLAYLNSSELRPAAAAEVWDNLMGEVEASALSKGLKKPKFDRIAFFASHPPQQERSDYLSALASPDAVERDDGTERYQEALAEWLPIFLDDQIKLNDFGGSDYLIENLAETGWTSKLWLARATLYRARGNPRDLVNAAEFYRNAISLDPDLAEAHRGLGLSLMKIGKRRDGQTSLRRYLELNPEAPDAKMIEMMAPKLEASE